MADPIYKVITAARIRLLINNPEIGEALSSWRLVSEPPSKAPMELAAGEHRYNREAIKSMTNDELDDALVKLVRQVSL